MVEVPGDGEKDAEAASAALRRVRRDAATWDSIEAYANGWRTLRVRVPQSTEPRDLRALKALMQGVPMAAALAGYTGSYDGTRAVCTVRGQSLRWSWRTDQPPATVVVAAARDLAEDLNPGTWVIEGDTA